MVKMKDTIKNSPPEREDHVRITKKLQKESGVENAYTYSLIRGIIYWGILLALTLLVGIILDINGYVRTFTFTQLSQLLLAAIFFLLGGIIHTKESSIALRKAFGKITKTRADINPLSQAELKATEFIIAAVLMFATSTLLGFIG